MILTEKQQKYQRYHWKIDKYQYLICEQRLNSNKRQMIKQTKFTNSQSGIGFEK